MYEYLKEHAYISKNKKSNYQFELTKERAECIANKYNSLYEEKDKEIEKLKKELEIEKDISDGMLKTIDKAIDYIEKPISLIYKKDCGRQFKKILEILKKEENNESSDINREIN